MILQSWISYLRRSYEVHFFIIFVSTVLFSSVKFASVDDAIKGFQNYLNLKLKDLDALSIGDVGILKDSIARFADIFEEQARGYLSESDLEVLDIAIDKAYKLADDKIAARATDIYIAGVFSKLDNPDEKSLSSAYSELQEAKTKLASSAGDDIVANAFNKALERVRVKMVDFYKARLARIDPDYNFSVKEAVYDTDFQIRQIDLALQKENDLNKSGIDWIIDKIRSFTGIKQKNIKNLQIKKNNLIVRKTSLQDHIDEKISRPAEILADRLISDPVFRFQGFDDIFVH